MIKISICGKMNSGKNTLATVFEKKFSKIKNCHLVAFADPIKEMVMTMFPWADRECLWGSSDKRSNILSNAIDEHGNPLTYRQVLNDLGGRGRTYNPKHWVNVFHERTTSLNAKDDIIICTDVRFDNELDYLNQHDYFNIKLIRNTVFMSNHNTETNQDAIPLERFDKIIMNNDSLDALNEQVEKVANIIALKYGY